MNEYMEILRMMEQIEKNPKISFMTKWDKLKNMIKVSIDSYYRDLEEEQCQ